MPLFPADFIADTTHLSAQESGAYLLLLMQAWLQPDCRLPNSDKKLASWARVDLATWRHIKGEVMAFWTLRKGRWEQGRLLKERGYVAAVSAKRKAAAEKRWRKKGNANAMQMHCKWNAPTPIPKETPNGVSNLGGRKGTSRVDRKVPHPEVGSCGEVMRGRARDDGRDG
jgi:uncharacterized protein YdaU (DUF1376 family)